ncbi:MAG: DUF58 domain-containing protein [Phycisphaerales bacterium]|nr:DUF58 domain-containing protein [Phycisphaerales bacterium]
MLKTPNRPEPRTIDELLPGRLAAKLTQLDLASRKLFAGKLKGERRSKKRGQSVEFADHRQYSLGDDTRFIDWNIFGRLDRLFVKLFLEEEDLSLHIVIDCSASMDCGEPSKFHFAQRAAAALAYIGLVNLNRVSLTAIADQPLAGPDGDTDSEPLDTGGVVSTIRNLRGRRRAQDLGHFLCGLTPTGPSRFTDAAKRIALARQGKGVMVVISDFFFKEGYEQALRYLVGRGYDLVAIQALSPQEVNPAIGGDLRLRDVEDADFADVTISAPLLKRYKANLAAYCDQLRSFCARRDTTLLTVQSDTAIDSLILDYLRTRGVVR